MSNNYKIETKCIQSGWQPTKGEPRVLPIYQSTTFKYDTSEQMGRLFDLEDSGYFYTTAGAGKVTKNPFTDPTIHGGCCGRSVQCRHRKFSLNTGESPAPM